MKTKHSIDSLLSFATYERDCFLQDAKNADNMTYVKHFAIVAEKFQDMVTILNQVKEQENAQR